MQTLVPRTPTNELLLSLGRYRRVMAPFIHGNYISSNAGWYAERHLSLKIALYRRLGFLAPIIRVCTVNDPGYFRE